MKFIDANQLRPASNVETDICIVGAGAAGITIASGLSNTSRNICLVESGSHYPDEQVQSLYDLENVGYPVRENFMSRARYFGGTTNLWPGRCLVLGENDFKKRAWVANSGWPIDYAELVDYYRIASGTLRLPDFDHFNPEVLSNKLGKCEAALMKDPCLSLNVALWAKRPRRFGRDFFTQLKKAPNIKTLLNLNVVGIVLNDNAGSVKCLVALTLNGEKVAIFAKYFVLACGGLENARLLLLSRDKQKNGVGNKYDNVGRYFMDHPKCVQGRVQLKDGVNLSNFLMFPLKNGKIQLGIRLSDRIQKEEGLLNNYLSLHVKYSDKAQDSYHVFVQRVKRLLRRGHAGKRFDAFDSQITKIPDLIYLLQPQEIMPHTLYRLYARYRNQKIDEFVIVNYCEQEPNSESRVTLSRQRDRLNMNLLRLDWRIGSKEQHSMVRLQELLHEYLRSNDAGYVVDSCHKNESLDYLDASHHMGTTRMSDDPRKGVVDKNCRVYDVANLFVAGSSVFPTSGHANPTLTIVALSLRLADFLATLP